MPQGVVTPPEVAAEVQARVQAGESIRSVARDLDLSPQGAKDLADGEHGGSVERVSPELLTQAKHAYGRKVWELASAARDRAASELQAMSGYQAAIVMGIATQRAIDVDQHLGLGSPTSVDVNVHLSLDRGQEQVIRDLLGALTAVGPGSDVFEGEIVADSPDNEGQSGE